MIEFSKIYLEDNLDTMSRIPDNFLDSIVTDPPYGISFMDQKWDYSLPGIETWKECLRVLKPGGYLLSFAGTRTHHRMCVNIEDAGFEIRDMIAWVYGSGFPKSMNIRKAIDKLRARISQTHGKQKYDPALPGPDKAAQWDGWGTALKPAFEPIIMARKPLSEKTVLANILKWGTGGINIDDCRVTAADQDKLKKNWDRKTTTDIRGGRFKGGRASGVELSTKAKEGRYPANFIHDGHQLVLSLFPDTQGQIANVNEAVSKKKTRNIYNPSRGKDESRIKRDDYGSAARFFYCAKASKKERNEGLLKGTDSILKHGALPFEWGNINWRNVNKNFHPTVKPIMLMRYLCRLVTPPGGVVYDPFCGSGTTCIAAAIEGFSFLGSENKKEYYIIGINRLKKYL